MVDEMELAPIGPDRRRLPQGVVLSAKLIEVHVFDGAARPVVFQRLRKRVGTVERSRPSLHQSRAKKGAPSSGRHYGVFWGVVHGRDREAGARFRRVALPRG